MATLDANKQIKGLRPHEVSLVGRPANKRRALLFKSANAREVDETPFELTPEQRTTVREKLASVAPQMDALINKCVRQLTEVRKDDAVEGAEDLGWDATTQSIMAGVGRIASQLVGKVTMDDWQYLLQQVGFAEDAAEDEDVNPDDNADEQQENEIGGGYVVVKDSDPKPSKEESMADKWDKPEGVDQKTHDQAKAAAMALYNSKVKGKEEKTEKDDGEEDDEEMDKSKKKTKSETVEPAGDERMTAILKAQKSLEEQNRKLVEKNEKMEAQLAEHTDYRVTKSIKDQVDSDLRHLGGDQAKLIRVIKHMRGVADKSLEEDLMQVLKGAEAQLAAGVSGGGSHFHAVGTSTSETGESALSRIEGLVDAMVQKSDNKLTRTTAYDKVMDTQEGRALYAQHISEKGR